MMPPPLRPQDLYPHLEKLLSSCYWGCLAEHNELCWWWWQWWVGGADMALVGRGVLQIRQWGKWVETSGMSISVQMWCILML